MVEELRPSDVREQRIERHYMQEINLLTISRIVHAIGGEENTPSTDGFTKEVGVHRRKKVSK